MILSHQEFPRSLGLGSAKADNVRLGCLAGRAPNEAMEDR